ncbi:MAG: hypothetical protein IH612_06185 [Desulfofustis sp.]|nr:hypothetical protein [Desulfofustis sp.]
MFFQGFFHHQIFGYCRWNISSLENRQAGAGLKHRRYQYRHNSHPAGAYLTTCQPVLQKTNLNSPARQGVVVIMQENEATAGSFICFSGLDHGRFQHMYQPYPSDNIGVFSFQMNRSVVRATDARLPDFSVQQCCQPSSSVPGSHVVP